MSKREFEEDRHLVIMTNQQLSAEIVNCCRLRLKVIDKPFATAANRGVIKVNLLD